MSYEQAVRTKHQFQANLKEFFRYASAMTIEEIELALGRIADRLSTSTAEQDSFHYQVKGVALKIYFDLRQVSQKSQVIILRQRLQSEMQDYFANLGRLAWQVNANQHFKRYEQYLKELDIYDDKLHDWHDEVEVIRKKVGFFKRIITLDHIDLPPQPARPKEVKEYYPLILEDEIDTWKQKANMEEFLIAKVTEYQLLTMPAVVSKDRTCVYDVTPDDVRLLAP